MQEASVKIKRACVSNRLILLFLLAALALVLTPVIYCGRFTSLSGDDYSYGVMVHQAVLGGQPFYKVIWAAFCQAYETYLNWQGTFSAVALMALSPAALFGESYYALTPFIMLLSLGAGIFLLSGSVYAARFGLKKSQAAIISAVTLLACSQLLPDIREGFYWYNGAVYYTFTFGLALCSYSCALSYEAKGGTARLIGLCLFAIILGGGNYVTALSSSLLVCAGILVCMAKKSPRRKQLLLPALLLLVCFALSILAPGNQMRQSSSGVESIGAISAVLLSLKYGAIKACQWMSLPLFGALLFLSPLMWAFSKGSTISFKRPWLITVASYLFFSSMFCPHIFSLGTPGPGRLQDILFFSYVILLVFNLFYWIAWLRQRKAVTEAEAAQGVGVGVFTAFTAAAVLCVGIHIYSSGTLSSVFMLGLSQDEETQIYYAETQARYTILNDSSVTAPVLPPYSVGPFPFFAEEISREPDYWINSDMSRYYGKDSIRLETVEP